MIEIWKDVVGYEGFYKVSNMGNVKRLECFRKNSNSGYIQKEKILKNTKRNNKTDYLCVSLCSFGNVKLESVHRIVAKAFLENPLNKKQVNHKNGIKSDNNVENLEWCTSQENNIHAIRVLKRKINKDGLKLGSIAKIKNDLNITDGKSIFNTYKDIISFVKKEEKYKNVKDRYIKTHVLSCCYNKQKTAYGSKWFFKKDLIKDKQDKGIKKCGQINK